MEAPELWPWRGTHQYFGGVEGVWKGCVACGIAWHLECLVWHLEELDVACHGCLGPWKCLQVLAWHAIKGVTRPLLGIIHHSSLRKYLSQRNKIDTITTQKFNVETPITGDAK
ncbi:uncharacterized protein DS421_1g31070 [Arachis hypogaea]|nr:uncharacterized protein DS421_1g31070 [Arachis hypogaea]